MTEGESRRTGMRRGAMSLAVLGLLVLAGPALAAPTATLKIKAIPIPGFPGTGNVLGAGAEVEDQMTISGTEYGGFPSPLTGINVYAPAGIRLDSAGFPTCAPTALNTDGP